MSQYSARPFPPRDPGLEMALPVKGFSQSGWERVSLTIFGQLRGLKTKTKTSPELTSFHSCYQNYFQVPLFTLKIQAPNIHFMTQTWFLE